MTYNWTPTNDQRTAWGVESDYTWDGWYSDAGLTTPYPFDKMPASNLVLYAKFNAPTYTVFFDVNDCGSSSIASQTVEKHKWATNPQPDPTCANHTFTGWFTDAACTSRYDFNAPVTGDITLYAGWSANPMTYTVNYVDGNNQAVYPSKTVTSPLFTVGQVITEQAMNVTGLIPDAATKTVTMSYEQPNVITFVYITRSETTSYTVQYVLASDHSVKVHADKVVSNIPGTTISVTEAALAPDKLWMEQNGFGAYIDEDYFPTEDVQDLVLSADVTANVLTFEYTNFQTTKFTINYLDMDGVAIPGKPQVQENLRLGDMYVVSTDPLNGWTYDHVTASNGGTVTEYINDGTPLTINVYYKKQLTITAVNLEKDYDGTALQSTSVNQVTVATLSSGHTLESISFTGSQTDAGFSSTTPEYAVISGPQADVNYAYYYDIEYVSGRLTVNPINVTITIDPDRWTGNMYTGNVYQTGFTNPNKTLPNGASRRTTLFCL